MLNTLDMAGAGAAADRLVTLRTWASPAWFRRIAGPGAGPRGALLARGECDGCLASDLLVAAGTCCKPLEACRPRAFFVAARGVSIGARPGERGEASAGATPEAIATARGWPLWPAAAPARGVQGRAPSGDQPRRCHSADGCPPGPVCNLRSAAPLPRHNNGEKLLLRPSSPLPNHRGDGAAPPTPVGVGPLPRIRGDGAAAVTLDQRGDGAPLPTARGAETRALAAPSGQRGDKLTLLAGLESSKPPMLRRIGGPAPRAESGNDEHNAPSLSARRRLLGMLLPLDGRQVSPKSGLKKGSIVGHGAPLWSAVVLLLARRSKASSLPLLSGDGGLGIHLRPTLDSWRGPALYYVETLS